MQVAIGASLSEIRYTLPHWPCYARLGGEPCQGPDRLAAPAFGSNSGAALSDPVAVLQCLVSVIPLVPLHLLYVFFGGLGRSGAASPRGAPGFHPCSSSGNDCPFWIPGTRPDPIRGPSFYLPGGSRNPSRYVRCDSSRAGRCSRTEPMESPPVTSGFVAKVKW